MIKVKLPHRLILVFVVMVLTGHTALAAEKSGGYAGTEFFGSSLVSRLELEKVLRLNAGASYEAADKALERLRLFCTKKNLKANVELVPESGSYFVCIDVLETGLNNTQVNRKLVDPHHINCPSEKPFSQLQELKARLEKLSAEGRPSPETYKNGYRFYADVAAMRIAELLIQELEGFNPYLYKILACDPNGERRADAAELLNWCTDPVANCNELIAALDDSDVRVRMAAAKYIWARLNILPDNFPFDDLLEGLSRQLSRPSHHDRIRAMSALLALAKRDSDSISGIKTFDAAKLNELLSNSVIPSVQNHAKQLLSISADPPPIQRKHRPSLSVPETGF